MASSAVIGGPSGVADLVAILQIAQGPAIALDAATSERIKKESPPPKDFKQESASELSITVAQTLSIVESRAAILCRLISIVNGSTKLRPAVVHYLIDILNARVNVQLPDAATDSDPLRYLAAAAAGTEMTVQGNTNTPLSEMLRQQQITAPGLSQQERTILQSGQWVTLGVAAVTVQSARQLMLASTAVAALSAEALQIQVSLHLIAMPPTKAWTALLCHLAVCS